MVDLLRKLGLNILRGNTWEGDSVLLLGIFSIADSNYGNFVIIESRI